MLIDAFVVFFYPHGPFEAPFYKIREEGSEFAVSEDRLNKHKVCNVRVELLFNPSFLLFSTSLFPSPCVVCLRLKTDNNREGLFISSFCLTY